MFDKIITGIGARDVREEMTDLGWDLGRYISDRNILLRTGDAKSGMDLAFLEGWLAGAQVGECIVYGPYKSYSAKTGECWDTVQFSNYAEAIKCVSDIVPHWNSVYAKLKTTDPTGYAKKIDAFRKLQTRNYFQIKGEIHTTTLPSDLVLFCVRVLGGIYIGGTATTVGIAKETGCVTMDISECSRELLLETIDKINFKVEDDIIPF